MNAGDNALPPAMPPSRGDGGPGGALRRLARRLVFWAAGSDLRDTRQIAVEARDEGRTLRDAVGDLRRQLEARVDQVRLAAEDTRSAVLEVRLPAVDARLDAIESVSLAALQDEIERVRDRAVPEIADGLRAALSGVSDSLRNLDAAVRDVQAAVDARVTGTERRLDLGERHRATGDARADAAEAAIATVQQAVAEIRDARLPAFNARVDALVAALHADLEATAGLVERWARHEPLRVANLPAEDEAALPAALTAASRQFLDEFRGTSEDVVARLAEFAPTLAGHAPVLDLGCGRGELLALLQRSGVEARGVDGDPAMVESCRRAGLDATVGDAVAAVENAPAASVGAIVAVHLLEHLAAAAWLRLLAACRTALRPGGLLVVECPTPESLRVGAELFWLDPTHRVPIHPQAVEFALRALGFEIVDRQRLHPFPPEQSLVREGQAPEVAELARRLDAWLVGGRDFRLVARRTADQG